MSYTKEELTETLTRQETAFYVATTGKIVSADVLANQCLDLMAENERLREALEFYSVEGNYTERCEDEYSLNHYHVVIANVAEIASKALNKEVQS